ncbi:MAG: ABC transporter permease [Alphaproteobacteria bacterium]|nr:ABC transporter permease [Alphaproteobacteria bacterium SS10]
MIGPLVAGLIGTVLPAFGYLPALGGDSVSLAPWRELLGSPGIGRSVWLSVSTGFGATVISLTIVTLFCAAWHGTHWFSRMQRLLSPLLSVPHVSVAFGIAFLIAPSGWLMRAISPELTGLTRPPDITIINDPYGLSLMLGLVVKEVPFLLLMTIAALGQVQADQTRLVTATFGYGRMTGWLKGTFPRIYAQIRLPVLAVLAFSMSVVDVALVLGPTTPPTLSVQLLRWMNDADLEMRFLASAGAILQLALVAAGLALWVLGERLVAWLGQYWLSCGARGLGDMPMRLFIGGTMVVVSGAVIFGLVGMAVWSFAGLWRFPDFLPDSWSLRIWMRQSDGLFELTLDTAILAIAATLIAVVMVMGCLEREGAGKGQQPRGTDARAQAKVMWLIYLPLLVPQIAFLFGLQVLLISIGLDQLWIALVWAHLVFVLPYLFLSLGDAYRSWDERYARTGLCLGKSAFAIWLRVKVPMLLPPILIAMAVGFAVSIGQYLPTFLVGGGRFATLTTEAVTLAAGGDRRVIGAVTLLQMILPTIGFILAMLIPAVLFRRRLGMTVNRI